MHLLKVCWTFAGPYYRQTDRRRRMNDNHTISSTVAQVRSANNTYEYVLNMCTFGNIFLNRQRQKVAHFPTGSANFRQRPGRILYYMHSKVSFCL